MQKQIIYLFASTYFKKTDWQNSIKYHEKTLLSEKDKYKIYTKKFDSVLLAESLCGMEETSKLRKQLDRQTEKLDSTITILANKLQRKLLAKQNRWWEFDLEEGLSKTIDWYLDNKEWLENVKSGEYQNYYKLNYK